jgi:class 3 adenylate cyclase
MDLGGWLRSLGLDQYEAAFRANEIDIDVLPELTEIDLEKLGVPLGHRKRLLKAIAGLAAADKLPPTSGLAPVRPETDAAERRQVTVMFSDLVGSTALSARMDPEDLREVISAYQKCVAETVRRFGGFVAKYMGDGVLVYFGYPQAHEDDAERAVRAGLELIAAVAGLKTRAALQTRVGIATGLVVVGDLVGSGEARERGIVGETPNLAARLQGIAEPNTVVIAEGTRKLLGNLFELQDLGAKDLKGIAGPVRASAALRASSVEGRFEALHATGLTALVGRDEELELLLRRWARAKTGEGQVVLLSGEAGIGKSRLIAALMENVATEPHTRLRYFCSLGYPEAALADADQALKDAREVGQATTLMQALGNVRTIYFQRGNYTKVKAVADELVALADEKGTMYWKAHGMMARGQLLALTGKASDAVQIITSALAAFGSTGATIGFSAFLSVLAKAYAELGQFDDAWRCIGEAITAVEATKETLFEADIHRTAGEIAPTRRAAHRGRPLRNLGSTAIRITLLENMWCNHEQH